MSAAASQLVAPTKDVPNNNSNNINTSSEHELQFYDSNAVLSTSREVAFGYLILLTGGNFEYNAPTLPENRGGDQQQEENKDIKASPAVDEDTSQLAYAAVSSFIVLLVFYRLAQSLTILFAPDC